MGELRKYSRFSARGTVVLKSMDGTDNNIYTDLVDLSFSGVCVYAKEKLEAGIDLNFELRPLLWSEPIVGRGKIRYVLETKKGNANVFKMGIDFLEVNNTAIQYTINRIIADNRAKKQKKIQKPANPDYGF